MILSTLHETMVYTVAEVLFILSDDALLNPLDVGVFTTITTISSS
jgi:hypothetical protein